MRKMGENTGILSQLEELWDTYQVYETTQESPT